jgi:hypothetical protein
MHISHYTWNKQNCVKSQNTHFIASGTVPKILPSVTKCGKLRDSQASHTWQYNTAHALCLLDNQGYRHTLRTCNACCLSTALMVTRKRLHITLCLHCLSCYHTERGVTFFTVLKPVHLPTSVHLSTNSYNNRFFFLVSVMCCT